MNCEEIFGFNLSHQWMEISDCIPKFNCIKFVGMPIITDVELLMLEHKIHFVDAVNMLMLEHKTPFHYELEDIYG